MLTGAFFGIWGADQGRQLGRSACVIALVGGAGGMVLALIHASGRSTCGPTRSSGDRAQLPGARGHRLHLHRQVRRHGHAGRTSRLRSPTCHLDFLSGWPLLGPIFGQLNLMIWLSFLLLIATYVFVFHTPYGLRLRSVGEHPRAADTVGISVYKVRYVAVIVSGDARGARRRLPLDRLRPLVQREHDRGHAGSSRLAALDLRQVAAVRRRSAPRCCSGSRARSPTGCPSVSATSGDALPGTAVRAHDHRRRRRDRPLRPARSRRPAV